MDVDELLNDDDDLDADYNLDNEAENALLEDGLEMSPSCHAQIKFKENIDENEQESEDVLDLEANEVDLNDEDEPDDNGGIFTRNKHMAINNEIQTVEKRDKFINERNIENIANKQGNSTNFKNVSYFNNNQQMQRNAGRGKGIKSYNLKRTGKTVLINPHFKGNVQVHNSTARLAWDSQKRLPFTNKVTLRQQTEVLQHRWVGPVQNNHGNFNNFSHPPVNFLPGPAVNNIGVNLPTVMQEHIPHQPMTNWNQCNAVNTIPQMVNNTMVNRNVPVHQRLGYQNNYNQQQQQQQQFQPPPPVIHNPFLNNTFSSPPPQYIPPFNPSQQLNQLPPPIINQNTFYNNNIPNLCEPPRNIPNYNYNCQVQPQTSQQIYNHPPPNCINTYEAPPGNIQNTFHKPIQKFLPQKSFNMGGDHLKRRADKNKMFEYRKKKRFFVTQNLQEIPTVIINQDNQPKEENNPEDQEDEEIREYRREIEKQKEMRERLLKLKEERRKRSVQTSQTGKEISCLTPAELVKKLRQPCQTPSALLKTNKNENYNNIKVKIENVSSNTKLKNSCNNNNCNVQVVEVDKQADCLKNVDDDTSSFSSSFLNNRKILCKDQFLPETHIVVVKNLAAGTTEVKLRKLCMGIGEVQKLQLSTQERQATIQFKSVASAHAFYKKYQRFMLDLSMIQVILEPVN